MKNNLKIVFFTTVAVISFVVLMYKIANFLEEREIEKNYKNCFTQCLKEGSLYSACQNDCVGRLHRLPVKGKILCFYNLEKRIVGVCSDISKNNECICETILGSKK